MHTLPNTIIFMECTQLMSNRRVKKHQDRCYERMAKRKLMDVLLQERCFPQRLDDKSNDNRQPDDT